MHALKSRIAEKANRPPTPPNNRYYHGRYQGGTEKGSKDNSRGWQPNEQKTAKKMTECRARRHAPLKNHPVEHGAAVHLGLGGRGLPRGYRNDVPRREAVVRHRRTADGVSFHLKGGGRGW